MENILQRREWPRSSYDFKAPRYAAELYADYAVA